MGPRTPWSEESQQVSQHPPRHPVAMGNQATDNGQGNHRELPGQRPGSEKGDRLVDTPGTTVGSMSPTSAIRRFGTTKSQVSGKGHRLGHTPSATVGDVSTNPLDHSPSAFLPPGDRRAVEGILARLQRPGDLEDFTTQVRAVRGCRRPVRLSGKVTGTGPKGLREIRFDTRRLPDGVLLKACGSRRETVCPPCASLYRGDAFALVASGLRGGKGVPETIGDHPAVLLTLTAPSFGAVHRQRPDGTCHPTGTRCEHGRALACGLRHLGSDPALGQALCPHCYDYEGAVLFNAGVSELWRRTTIYALRALGVLLDLSSRQAFAPPPALLRQGRRVPEAGLGPPPCPRPGRPPGGRARTGTCGSRPRPPGHGPAGRHRGRSAHPCPGRPSAPDTCGAPSSTPPSSPRPRTAGAGRRLPGQVRDQEHRRVRRARPPAAVRDLSRCSAARAPPGTGGDNLVPRRQRGSG